MSRDRRAALIRKGYGRLSIVRQCRLLGLKRSTLYSKGTGENDLNLKLMRIIDKQFMDTPFFGSRQMARWLRRQGKVVPFFWTV